MIKFNVPNLFYFPMSDVHYWPEIVHVGRTMIAGCTTECGRVLRAGQPWTRAQPTFNLCERCVYALQHLTYQRGFYSG